MSSQVAYLVGKPLTEDTVRRLWRYVSGRLCDLYGAETPLYLGRPYVIQRINMLPFLPRVDKILEISVDETTSTVNCYFARDRWVKRMRNTLERITESTVVELGPPKWKRVDIEVALNNYLTNRR